MSVFYDLNEDFKIVVIILWDISSSEFFFLDMFKVSLMNVF